MNDWIKLAVVLLGYFGFAPLWGFVMSKNRRLEEVGVFLLVLSIGLHIDSSTIMLGSIEWYRGYTKGFEFTLMEVFSVGLIVCRLIHARKDGFRILPPGTLLWHFYLTCSLLSLVSSLKPEYSIMALFHFGKVWLIVWALGNYIRDVSTLTTVFKALAWLVILQALYVFKIRFIDKAYPVKSNFEHQNGLATFTNMILFVLLSFALGLGGQKNQPNFLLRLSWVEF